MKIPAFLARDVIYPLQERAFKRPTFSYLAQLEKSQWLSRAEVEALQLEKLRRLLQVAHAHCPWHRERMEAAGLSAENLSSLADLARLPRMDKQDAAANRENLVWHDVPGGTFKYNTGGSSGSPLILYLKVDRKSTRLNSSH